MLGVPSAWAGAACGGGGSSLPQLGSDKELMDPEQPASVNAEINTAIERRSMEQAMDTPPAVIAPHQSLRFRARPRIALAAHQSSGGSHSSPVRLARCTSSVAAAR